MDYEKYINDRIIVLAKCPETFDENLAMFREEVITLAKTSNVKNDDKYYQNLNKEAYEILAIWNNFCVAEHIDGEYLIMPQLFAADGTIEGNIV